MAKRVGVAQSSDFDAHVSADYKVAHGIWTHAQSQFATTAKARAYRSGNQENLTSGSETTVQLNAESYDPGSNFNTGTYLFTAPVSGYYLILAQITYVNIVADKRYSTSIYIDSTLSSLSRMHSGLDDQLSIPASDILYVAAGSTIKLVALQSSGANTVDIYGLENRTFLSVHLLSLP